MRPLSLVLGLTLLLWFISAFAQNSSKASDDSSKPRVFITDSQSWEVAGGGGGSGAGFGSAASGGARPQTAEIIKTFGERCPQVVTNNIQQKGDYIVLLDHEGGKNIFQHRNKVAVFARISGDSIVSKSTLSLGASVQEACEAINKDWAVHGSSMRAVAAAAQNEADPPVQPVASASATAVSAAASSAKLFVSSTPGGADIEIDGSFVGNTPSDLQINDGEHTISVKKSGFKDWERKLKVSGGSDVHLSAELEKTSAP